MTNQTRDYGDLRVTMTSAYTWKWDPSGNESRRSLCLWHPNAQGNLKPLGTYANPQGFYELNGKRASLLVRSNPNTNPSKPAVARLTDFVHIWNDRGAYDKHNDSLWRLVAPAGYDSLEDVDQYNWDKPSLNMIWCVRSDLVEYGKFPTDTLWDDGGSGAYTDAYLWAIMPNDLGIEGNPNIPIVADTFRAQTTGERPRLDLCRILILSIEKHYENFDAPVPEINPHHDPHRGPNVQLYGAVQGHPSISLLFWPNAPVQPESYPRPILFRQPVSRVKSRESVNERREEWIEQRKKIVIRREQREARGDDPHHRLDCDRFDRHQALHLWSLPQLPVHL